MENSDITSNTLDFKVLKQNIEKNREQSFDLFNKAFNTIGNTNNALPKEIIIDENIDNENYKKQVDGYNNLIAELNYQAPKDYANKTQEEQKKN